MLKQYDVIHFEALGAEAKHLEEKTAAAIRAGELPEDFQSIITPDTVQDYLAAHPGFVLPELITTKTHSVLPESYLKGSKKNIVTRSAGYDHFEQYAGLANITSLREYCVNAVAQTAVKLLYAAAGLLNHYRQNALTFERNHSQSFMEFTKGRTATVFGAGKIGKRICELLEGNGLNVQAVDIRQDELQKTYQGSVRFVSREEAARSSDIAVCAMNLTRSPKSRYCNVGYFSEAYLASFRKKFLFINVTRGEIAPESNLLEFYDKGKITGIGIDVFSDEDGFQKALNGQAEWKGKDRIAAKKLVKSAVKGSANIYVQPHQAFNSDIAAESKAENTIRHIAAWYRNGKTRFDEQLPYYQE
ncbi:Hydroxyacid dehydrogenase [Ruminococcaceae bacterium BL-6]|nr:Hydroxyacid dehydrogenase [Ruminococcaceae bacterium BL-6]